MLISRVLVASSDKRYRSPIRSAQSKIIPTPNHLSPHILATMSGKRSRDQLEGIHESRQTQLYEDGAIKMPAQKKRREGPPKIRKQLHASSVNAVKKRIRDVTRLLNRGDDLPADVRRENERALEAYKQELNEADEEKVRQQMIKKYHMVRFFGMLLHELTPFGYPLMALQRSKRRQECSKS